MRQLRLYFGEAWQKAWDILTRHKAVEPAARLGARLLVREEALAYMEEP